MATGQPPLHTLAGRDGEQLVARRLLRLGATVLVPVVATPGIDLAVRTTDGRYVELQVHSNGGGAERGSRCFRVERLRPRNALILVCLAYGEMESPEAWVLPSALFDRFATSPPADGPRELDMDAPGDGPLAERLKVYRDRWKLITSFSSYESVMRDPQALAVRLALDAP